MSINIKAIEKNEVYTINNKEVYRDQNNNWIAREELTALESKSFGQYRRSNGLS